MNNNFGSDLTGGNVAKQLLKFCIPFLLSNLLQALYNIADMFIVGQFDGPAGISGVSNGGQVTLLIINFVAGLAVGATVLVAQHVGAKRHEDAQKAVATVFTLMAVSGIAISIIMAFLSEPIMRLIQTPEESFKEALDYVRICSYGIVFTFLYNAISGVMRGLGDSKHPLIFVAIACVVNIVLDLILIGGFKMSAAGAAWATIASQAISVIISVVYLKKSGFMFDFKLKSFKIHRKTLSKILKIGFPSAIQNVVTSLSFMVITILVNGYGVDASAAAGIAGKFNSVAILPIIAMSMSVASMAGQNIGARLYDRALDTMKTSIKISFVIGGIIFLFVQLFPGLVISIFDNSEAVVAYGVQYIRAFSFDYIIVPIVFSVNGLLNGAGHTTFSLFNGMLSAVLLRAPFAILLGEVFDLGMLGIGLGGPIASLGSAIIGIIYVKSGRWKISRIEGK
ncbi:MAG: MATE family efflux transporter [Clostridia bacterium]|nr:MATE family efflux transporter [Clostridia bacterium]